MDEDASSGGIGTSHDTPVTPDVRVHVPQSIRNATFPHAVRGYDRGAVDAYVKQVNRVIAELEVSRSPQKAVRHALDRVGEQVAGILQRARETAEEITSSARAEADEASARARAEAADLVVSASAEAEATRSDAAAELSRAHAEGAEAVAQAERQAEAVVTEAEAEAAEQLAQVRLRIDAAEEEALARLREIHVETEQALTDRQRLADELRTLATRITQLASATAPPDDTEGEEPAEPAPADDAPRPTGSSGDRGRRKG